MVEYDAKVIQEHAAKLYTQTKSMVPAHFFIGIFAGLLTAMVISTQLMATFDFLILSIGVLIGGVIGYGVGKNKAFELQLQAQQALCQLKIEENTRK